MTQFNLLLKTCLLGSLAGVLSTPAFAVISGNQVQQDDPIATTSAAFIQDAVPNVEYPTGTELDPCSGTIFSEDVVLTAAHCIKENPVGKKIVFGVDIYAGTSVFRSIDNYAIDPDYHPGYAGQSTIPKNNSDIAVLHFMGGLPPGFRKADLVPVGYQITGKERVIVAGYGIVSLPKVDQNNVVIDPNAWLGDGVLRKTDAMIFTPNYAATEIQVRETDRAFASSGDSGGPAFITIDGEILFIGVDNWGDRQDNTPFEVYADVRAHIEWINSAIASFHSKSN